MSKALSLKLRDEVFREAEEIRRRNGSPRNAYFNEAIEVYNKLWRRKLLQKALVRESRIVAEDSLEVLRAFEMFEDDLVE